MTRVSAQWLALREPADAAARDRDLLKHLPPTESHVIHDLGCGTGAMGRWLAPLLAGRQHWVLHDRDEDLLEVAAANPPAGAVTVETALSDVTRVDLTGATLVTCSALLDMLTEEELSALVAACARAACPVLLTLSVVGEVELTPADALDNRVAAAFNAHQRRGRLLGPDAPAVAAEAFRNLGAEVLVRPSPWLLGPDHAELTAEWFAGWSAAACEQEPDLAAHRRRPPLEATVGHADLLVLPR